MRDLAGKAAVVTGGAGGIGFAVARAFLTAGMKVMLADIESGAPQGTRRTAGVRGPGTRD